MTHYKLSELYKITGSALHILRRDAKLLFPNKQSQGVASEYTLNEGFVLYLSAYLVGVKKFNLEQAGYIITKLMPYLKKKGLLPEGKKPEADERQDKKFEDQLGEIYTIPDAPIVYPTKIYLFAATMRAPEDQIYEDIRIIAHREGGAAEVEITEGHQTVTLRRIIEVIYELDDGYEIDFTQETVLPISRLLDKFDASKSYYETYSLRR